MKLKSSKVIILLIIIVLITTISCKKSITIKDIVDNPTQYETQTVTVSGSVANSNAIAGLGYFELRDGSAQIIVLSKSGVPLEGATVAVTGKVSQYLKIGFMQVVGIESTEISQ
jgi:exonuclease VII large subunit